MSSTESSGAPAEATETSPASAAFPSFGSTRGSGLARGKRPSAGPAAATNAASTPYTPTAIEVVKAPREYQNPFAPAESEPVEPSETPAAPVADNPAPFAAAAPVRPEPSAIEASPAPAESAEPAELNILPPEQQKTVPAQTWESDGFRPAREPRADRPPRRHERSEGAPRQEIPTPEKFLYVRPGHHYVPTPSNYGGAPRESAPAASVAAPAAEATAPAKSGGFLGWLKSLFGGGQAAPATAQSGPGEQRHDGRRPHGRQRGGHSQYAGGDGGQRRRRRGGRSRSRGEYRGGDQGGAAAT